MSIPRLEAARRRPAVRPALPAEGEAPIRSVALGALGVWTLTVPLIAGATGAHPWERFFAGSALFLAAVLLAGERRQWPLWLAFAAGAWLVTSPALGDPGDAWAVGSDALVGAGALLFSAIWPVRADGGPTVPDGWTYNPSDWTNRLPPAVLALAVFFLARSLAAGIDGSALSDWRSVLSWDGWAPVGADAAAARERSLLAALAMGTATVLLMGDPRRWRTRPWTVFAGLPFLALLAVAGAALVLGQPFALAQWRPLGAITGLLALGVWPSAVDEAVASAQFLAKTRRQHRSALVAFFRGDDAVRAGGPPGRSDRRPLLDVPLSLVASAALGAALVASPALDLGGVAGLFRVAGLLGLEISFLAMAEAARTLRFLNIPVGLALLASAGYPGAEGTPRLIAVVAGVGFIVLSLPRGRIRDRRAEWDRWVL